MWEWEDRVDNSLAAVEERRRVLQLEKHEFHHQLQREPIGTEWLKSPFMKARYLGFDAVEGVHRFAASFFGKPECDDQGRIYDLSWHQTSETRWQSGLTGIAVVQDDDETTIYKNGKKATWKAKISWDTGEEIEPLGGPYVPDWSEGATLEWDYGFMRRTLQLCVQGVREVFYIDCEPDSIPEGAMRLIIDTKPTEDTGIAWQEPYIASRGSQYDSLEEAVLAQGYKEIPLRLLTKGHLPLEIDDSATYYAGTGDGYAKRAVPDESWDVARDATTASEIQTTWDVLYTHADTVGASKEIIRIGVCFDTSGLPDSAIIQDGTKFSGYCSVIGPSGSSVIINGGNSTCPHTTMIVTDYNRALYDQAIGASRASCTASAWNDFTLTATGRGWINATGVTRLLLRERDHDYNNVDPGVHKYQSVFYSADYDGGSLKPELYVVYSVAEAPTVTTQAADLIGPTSARGNGNITDDGEAEITEHGVCWKKDADPVDIAGADGYTEEGAGEEGAFTSNMTLLDPESTYYYRAYATNASGPGYGAAQSFKTMISAAASGQTTSEGSAAGLLQLLAQAAGVGTTSGAAAGLLDLIGASEGQMTSSGAAACHIALPASAEGLAVSSGLVAGYLGLRGDAEGLVISSGAAACHIALPASAEGLAVSSGAAAALLALLANADGTAVSSGTAAALLELLATAEGLVVSSGEAAALLELLAAAEGLMVTSGEVIFFTPYFLGDLGPGETIIFNHGGKTVTIDGVNALKDFAGTFWPLLPGTWTLRYRDLEDSRNLTITVTYKDKWI